FLPDYFINTQPGIGFCLVIFDNIIGCLGDLYCGIYFTEIEQSRRCTRFQTQSSGNIPCLRSQKTKVKSIIILQIKILYEGDHIPWNLIVESIGIEPGVSTLKWWTGFSSESLKTWLIEIQNNDIVRIPLKVGKYILPELVGRGGLNHYIAIDFIDQDQTEFYPGDSIFIGLLDSIAVPVTPYIIADVVSRQIESKLQIPQAARFSVLVLSDKKTGPVSVTRFGRIHMSSLSIHTIVIKKGIITRPDGVEYGQHYFIPTWHHSQAYREQFSVGRAFRIKIIHIEEFSLKTGSVVVVKIGIVIVIGLQNKIAIGPDRPGRLRFEYISG